MKLSGRRNDDDVVRMVEDALLQCLTIRRINCFPRLKTSFSFVLDTRTKVAITIVIAVERRKLTCGVTMAMSGVVPGGRISAAATMT
jgi:hypothetical protein